MKIYHRLSVGEKVSDYLDVATPFLDDDFSLPPVEEFFPMQYFKKFWSNKFTENLVALKPICLV